MNAVGMGKRFSSVVPDVKGEGFPHDLHGEGFPIAQTTCTMLLRTA
jgi:hypothetical protein